MRTEKASRSKGRTIFAVFAASLFITCGALCIGGLFRLYKMAAAYELSSPDNAANSALSLFKAGKYSDILSLCDITLSEFEDEQDFAKALKAAAPNGAYSFKRIGAEGYRLMRGDTVLAELSLSCEKEGGSYGFDRWHIDSMRLSAIEQQSYTVTVPKWLKASVNGTALWEDLLDSAASEQEKAKLCTAFGGLPEEFAPETPAVYRLSGLFSPPKISVESPPKTKIIIRDLNNNYTVSLYPSSDIISELSDIGIEAACMYARYITNDAVLDDILPYFLPQSQYYTHLKQFYNGWYNTHDSYSFEEPRFASWQIYDENHVSCVILFNYRITMGRHQYEYPSKYSMSFVKSPDGWKLSNLVVI